MTNCKHQIDLDKARCNICQPEGRCRFNCRTQREAFMAGWWSGISWVGASYDSYGEDEAIESNFQKWKANGESDD